MNFLNLTPQITGKILSYLPLEDHFRFQKTCHLLRIYSSRRDFKIESQIKDIWKSRQTRDFLLTKFFPPDYAKETIAICRRNNISTLVKKVSCLALVSLAISLSMCFYINQEKNMWREKPIRDRIQLMQQRDSCPEQRDWLKKKYLGSCYIQKYKNLEKIDQSYLFFYEEAKWVSLSVVVIAQIVFLFIFLQKHKQTNKKVFETANQRIICTISYPSSLKSDKSLEKYICQLSKQIPLIPVLDKEGRRFDYAYVKSHIPTAVECPPESQYFNSSDLYFDIDAFIIIQNRLKFLKSSHSPLVKKIPYSSIFNFSENLI